MKSRIFTFIFGGGLILFFVVSLFVVSYAQDTSKFFLDGFVNPPVVWKGGNSGKVQFFGSGEIQEGREPYFDQNGKLYGNFWLGSSGWANFNHGVSQQEVKILCPEKIIEQTVTNKNLVCPLSGSAWSENAGWIIFSGSTIGMGSGVYYNPNSANIEGFGWSESLGWVPVFSGVKFDDTEVEKDTMDQLFVGSGTSNQSNWYETVDNPVGGANINFIGRVAVIGNIAGSKVFHVINQYKYHNQNPGYRYDTVQHAPIFNAIRGNVAQLTRNLSGTEYITKPHNGFLYNTDRDYCFMKEGTTNSLCPTNSEKLYFNASTPEEYKKAQTIIIRGHDVIIDDDFNATNENIKTEVPKKENMKAIIALKDDNGNGGNIYITKNVGKIYAYIIAEGSVFSGEKKGPHPSQKIYVTEGEFKIPQKQLYINGIVISKNTIGGVGKHSECPILTKDCSENNAKNYDMSYFRNYNPKDPSQSSLPPIRSHLIDQVKKATVIIDYNQNIIYSPPIGLDKFQ